MLQNQQSEAASAHVFVLCLIVRNFKNRHSSGRKKCISSSEAEMKKTGA
jgi:hypothetical protein